MKKVVLLSLVLLVTCLTGVLAQEKKQLLEVANEGNKPSFKFESEEFNFGTIKQGESVTHEFVFTNTGNEPLLIMKADGSCGCTVPEYPKEPILKNQKGKIKVTFNSAGKVGMQDKTVTIQSNAKTNPKVIHI